MIYLHILHHVWRGGRTYLHLIINKIVIIIIIEVFFVLFFFDFITSDVFG